MEWEREKGKPRVGDSEREMVMVGGRAQKGIATISTYKSLGHQQRGQTTDDSIRALFHRFSFSIDHSG